MNINYKHKKGIAFIVLIASICLFFSCRKEEGTSWDTNLLAPIAHTSLNLATVFPDTLVATNPDGTLKLAFETELFNFTVDSLIKIPDTSLFYNYPFPAAYFPITPGLQFFPTSTSSTTFPLPNGILLKKATIKSGFLKIELKNSIRQPAQFIISIPSAKYNGVAFADSIIVPGKTPADTGRITKFINLSNYDLTLTGSPPIGSNTLIQSVFYRISPTAAPTDTIYYGEGVSATTSFIDIVPQYAEGYFGNSTLTVGPDTALFNTFNSISSGTLDIQNASFNLKLINGFGVDLRAIMSNVNSISTPNSSNVSLNANSVINNPININRSIKTFIPSNPVTSSIKNVPLNQNNSNITSFIGNLPNQLSYALNAQVNPLGNISGSTDFAYYGTSLKAILSGEIPLNAAVNNITFKDTVDINFGDLSYTENVNYGYLNLIAKNGYPLSMNVQAYLLDANNVLIDSLFLTPNTIDAGYTDANNIVISPKTSTLKAPVNQDKIAKLKSARKVYFIARFNTPNAPTPAQFYNTYTLDLNLTADFNYTIKQ